MPEYEHFCTQKDKFDYITVIQLVVIVRDKIVIKWFSSSYDVMVKECWVVVQMGCSGDALIARVRSVNVTSPVRLTNTTELVLQDSKYNTLINHTPL